MNVYSQEGVAESHHESPPAETALPAVLDPKITTYHVVDNLFVTFGEQPCTLSRGDWLRILEPPASGAETARVRVTVTQGDDCPVDAVVSLRVNDLQEMHNEFAEFVTDSMTVLEKQKGDGGLPAAPRQKAHKSPEGFPKHNQSDAIAIVQKQPALAENAEQTLDEEAFEKSNGN